VGDGTTWGDRIGAPNPRYRCPLARLLPEPTDLEAIKRAGWRDQGIVVVSVSDARLDWVEHELLERIGERRYGRTGGYHVDRLAAGRALP
jgi:hypothetical protein